MRPGIKDRTMTQLRLNTTLFQKIKAIAEREYRPANTQIEYFLMQCVKRYEAENGTIDIPDKEE